MPESLLVARTAVVAAAAAHRLLPLDCTWPAVSDHNGFEVDCGIGRRLGFKGKAVLHPSQVR